MTITNQQITKTDTTNSKMSFKLNKKLVLKSLVLNSLAVLPTALSKKIEYYEAGTTVILTPQFDTSHHQQLIQTSNSLKRAQWTFSSADPKLQSIEHWFGHTGFPDNAGISKNSNNLNISSIDFKNEGTYKCIVDSLTTCGEFKLRVGYLPVRPTKFQCISQNLDQTMECTWEIESSSLAIDSVLKYNLVTEKEENLDYDYNNNYSFEDSFSFSKKHYDDSTATECKNYCNDRHTCCKFDLSAYLNKTKLSNENIWPDLSSFAMFVYTENNIGKSYFLNKMEAQVNFVYPKFMIVPSQPEKIVIESTNAKSVDITIRPPNKFYYNLNTENVNTRLVKLVYQLAYKSADDEEFKILNEGENMQSLPALKSNKKYLIKARVRTGLTKLSSAFRFSKWTDEIEFTTDSSRPTASIEGLFTTVNRMKYGNGQERSPAYTATLRWLPYYQRNSPGTKFKVTVFSCSPMVQVQNPLYLQVNWTSLNLEMFPKECVRVVVSVVNSQGIVDDTPVETIVNLDFDNGILLRGPSLKSVEFDTENSELKYNFANLDDSNVNSFRLNYCQVDRNNPEVCIERVKSRMIKTSEIVNKQIISTRGVYQLSMKTEPGEINFCNKFMAWVSVIQGETDSEQVKYVLRREVSSDFIQVGTEFPKNVEYDIDENDEDSLAVRVYRPKEMTCGESAIYKQFLKLENGDKVFLDCASDDDTVIIPKSKVLKVVKIVEVEYEF